MSGELIYGVHAVKAALRYDPGQISEVWLERGRRDARVQRLFEALEALGVPVHRSARRELDELTGSEQHQGVAVRYSGGAPRSEQDLASLLDSLEVPFLLILDQVTDPHNLGACLRTADAVGVDAVIAPRDRAVGLTPTVHKVASGAASSTPFFQVTNMARTLRDLQSRGVWMLGAAGEADVSLHQADFRGPVAIVMGAEDTGLRRLTREHCDLLVSIPMHGRVESLNVSVATGVMLYEALRQRGAS